MGDNIKKPDHYCDGRKYEPKDVIRDWGLNFNLGSAVKYISRAGRKGDKLEDLKKAKQFLEFEIEAEEKANEVAKANKVCNYVNGLLSRFIGFDSVLEEYKPRVINRLAQEVLNSRCNITLLDMPTKELQDMVLTRIVERIDNDELTSVDICKDLYCGYQEIRDALGRQALRHLGEEQKSDIGMTCKEAAEIGDALAKGFEEGIKEAQNKNDVTCGWICTRDVLNGKIKFEDVPNVLKPLVFKGIADEVLNGMVDISSDILSDELREKIIDYAIEKLEDGDLSPFDLPTYIMDHPRVADWGRSLQKILNRIHIEDSVEITFKFEKED